MTCSFCCCKNWFEKAFPIGGCRVPKVVTSTKSVKKNMVYVKLLKIMFSNHTFI